MTRPLRLHDAADVELNEAADYYDLESPGLGEVFLKDIEKGFRRIREHPDAATAVAPGIRKLVLTRFPFAIIYSTRADTVRVLAIAHQRKRPYYWRSRG